MEAINYARDMKMDVVLVDTAGRMQVVMSIQLGRFFHIFSLRVKILH